MPLPLNHPQSLSLTHIILIGILISTCSCSPSFCLSHLFCWGLEDYFYLSRSSHHEFGPPLLPSIFISASVSLWLLLSFMISLFVKKFSLPVCLFFLFFFHLHMRLYPSLFSCTSIFYGFKKSMIM